MIVLQIKLAPPRQDQLFAGLFPAVSVLPEILFPDARKRGPREPRRKPQVRKSR